LRTPIIFSFVAGFNFKPALASAPPAENLRKLAALLSWPGTALLVYCTGRSSGRNNWFARRRHSRVPGKTGDLREGYEDQRRQGRGVARGDPREVIAFQPKSRRFSIDKPATMQLRVPEDRGNRDKHQLIDMMAKLANHGSLSPREEESELKIHQI
jgi:hypothetical protein